MYLSALTVQRGRCTVPCREFQHKGKETLPGGCGTWAGSRWPTPPQPLIFKVTSADFMQMAAWNIQLYTERVFLYQKKRKQKDMFNVFQILIGEIITLGDSLETVAANYREMTTLIICCLCCKYHPLFLKIQGCYLHVCCTQGSISPVGQHRRLPNYILLWQKNNWFTSACVSKYIHLWSSSINCIKYA